MKRLIFVIALLIAFVSVDAQKTIRYQLLDDEAMTNGDTASGIYPGIISDSYYYSVQIVCDSTSGSANGTAYLQQGNHTTPEKWTTISGKTLTLGVGNVTTFQTLWEGGVTPFLGTKLKVYIISSGVGVTTCNAYMVLKPLK